MQTAYRGIISAGERVSSIQPAPTRLSLLSQRHGLHPRPQKADPVQSPPPAEVGAAPPSLPPAASEALAPPPPATKPRWFLPKSSVVRKKALAIIAMRANGYTRAQISEELGIAPSTIDDYVYRATKSGALVGRDGRSLLADPKEELETTLAHKIVRNFNEALDSPDEARRDHVTLEVAKGTIFKRFDPAKEAGAAPMTVLAVKIEMPAGAAMEARPGSIGGTPAYTEGEIVDGTL